MNVQFLCLLAILGLASAEFPLPGSPAFVNDNNVLQYALTLELLEANFYQMGLMMFTEQQFISAGYNTPTYAFLTIIRDHELAHVQVLNALISSRGATPVTACNYTFNYASVNTFLATALILEETGVTAYDGAITSITQTDLKTLAASVASVEARHAAYLNQLNMKQPFYNATDNIALKPAIIAAVAANFLNGSCASANYVSALNLLQAADVSPLSAIQNSTQSAASFANDNNVLQFALTLENLESAFFTTALQVISRSSFTKATGSNSTYDLFAIIRDHEIAHANALRSTLIARGVSNPVGPCGQYYFSFNDTAAGARQFIMDSYSLELVGLEAFIGSSALLTDENLLSFGATVITVEARHISFERNLLGNLTGDFATWVPFPNVTDAAGVPAVLLTMAARFVNFTTCPNFTVPVPADFFKTNSTVGGSSGSSSSGSSSTGSASNSNSASSASASNGGVIGSDSNSASASNSVITNGHSDSNSPSGASASVSDSSNGASGSGSQVQVVGSSASMVAISAVLVAASALFVL